MRSHHAGVTGSGKSARRIVSRIAERLPRGFRRSTQPQARGCFGPGNEVLIDGEIHRLKILVVDGYV
jgi:hypothetical protein